MGFYKLDPRSAAVVGLGMAWNAVCFHRSISSSSLLPPLLRMLGPVSVTPILRDHSRRSGLLLWSRWGGVRGRWAFGFEVLS